MDANLIGLYKENAFVNNDIKFLNIEWRTWYSLTDFGDHFGLHGSVIFRPQYVWFLVHLYVLMIPNSSGQLAELFILFHQNTSAYSPDPTDDWGISCEIALR